MPYSSTEKFRDLSKRVEFFPVLCDNNGVGFAHSLFFAMKRSAFTLVELLVVIAVVALLLAILFPAIIGARETSRRGHCIVRQRDLAIAMNTYAVANNGLPGYLNELGTTPVHSWAVSVFPMIGENKRYEVLMKTSPAPDEVAQAIVPLSALLCPSDNPQENRRLNYIVNCGPVAVSGVSGDIAPVFTLFRDRRAGPISVNKKVKIEDIPNGASNTILLSENVDAGIWHWTVQSNEVSDGNKELETEGQWTRDKGAVENLGFIWWKDQAFAPNAPASKPRPSSMHPGAVIVAYADGSAKPMNDDIDISVYLKAVCVDSAEAKSKWGW